ncbi:MAG: hypothetical protein ACKOC8_09110 [Pirellulales bacterium]
MLTPEQVIDTYFLEARHMLLELAALLDRHDAAVARGGSPTGAGATAAKLAALRDALTILRDSAAPTERTVALLERFAQV